MTPLVSILIPVYNRENFIAEAIESAIAQTYDKIEIIIVDNASTDKSFEIATSYTIQDLRVKVIRNAENVGRVENWNIALRAVSGDFFHFLMSDDRLAPTAVEKMVYVTETYKNVSIVSSGHQSFPSGVSFCFFDKETYLDGMEAYRSIIYNGNWLAGLNNNLFSTRAMVACGGFDTQLTWGADWNFFLAMLKKGNLVYIPEILSFFREHSGRMSDKGLMQSFYEDWLVRQMAYLVLSYQGESYRSFLRMKLRFILLSLSFFANEKKSKNFDLQQKIVLYRHLCRSVGLHWVLCGEAIYVLKAIIKILIPVTFWVRLKKIFWGKNEM